MTPTLALVVERETAIDSFKKEKFYTVELDCGFPAASDRMADKKAAEKLKLPVQARLPLSEGWRKSSATPARRSYMT